MSGNVWQDQNPDPGGTKSPTPQEVSDLKDQNEQQLVLIAQLKEMLRKEQSTVSQDKVEEYVNTLNRARAKKSKQKKDDSSSTSTPSLSANIDANKKERVNLLRQQLEENKARLAQRGKSQKGIEEMVNQFQAQLKDSQLSVSSVSFNASFDTKNLDYNEETPQRELYNILLTKEKKITDLLAKSQKLEGTVIDLQENLKEKDSVIDARTKAITLMTDSLSKKGKNTLDALEETKDQMRTMQENFVTLETEMKARQLTLLNDLKMKNFEISELQREKAELELKLPGRLSPLGDNADLQNEICLLRAENEKLQKNIEDNEWQKKYNEIVEMNASSISKIAELELARDYQEKEYLTRIKELETQLEETATDLRLLRNTSGIKGSLQPEGGNEEVSKLKKQLDESNKNMIKMRAVQKGKIKELNKKLEQFRKMNDANALIVQLQNENGKLNEKIVELEAEKGNLQLKMVESGSSSKEDFTEHEEEIGSLKEKLSETVQELEEKNKVIDILEADVILLKAELKQKSEESIQITSQVSSEMSSICYEEQIEVLETEKKKLLDQLNLLNADKQDLQQEIEQLKKEKQEINSKLDVYIQENIELIDKLEKLSAEKVSSAESIEIVEGLTQQEKLEMAAYQRHIMNPEEHLKCPDDDSIEAPVELNETVLQLSEDTAELLQKIEMFTQERKEVMQKMETLKEDNVLLTTKIKEIENNRDILEETYEQLQNEKELLQNEKQELSDKLENLLESQSLEKQQKESANILDQELKDMQIKCKALLEENDELKRTLKQFDSIVQEKDDLESNLRDIVENNANLDSRLNSNLDEINAYQLTIEENKSELINSAETINRLHKQLEERENDIQELHINISELNSVINELQTKQNNFDVLESELGNLKFSLSNQLEQAAEYESEISQNTETIRNLNEELVIMNRRILELENELEVKDSELQKLTKEITNKDSIIKNLQQEAKAKDDSFKVVSEDMKVKYLQLKEQLEGNDGTLQNQISELHTKNKEQLEKMKKIAANLKKKSQAYQDLEGQYKKEKEKWETEDKEKESLIDHLKKEHLFTIKSLEECQSELNKAMHENILIQNEVRNCQEEIDILQQNNADQQRYIQELKHKQEKLQETSLQKEMSASLHEEMDDSFSKHIADDKNRELELLVETLESDLSLSKERVDKLQEDLRKLEESKTNLETTKVELTNKLDMTTSRLEEKDLLQEKLQTELSEVTADKEALTKELQKLQSDHDESLKKNQEHEDLIKRLKVKLKKAHDKVTELKTTQENLQEIESANQQLKIQIASLEDNQRHIQSENESLQKRNMSDYERIEADYQTQLAELLTIKNDLTTTNEKLQEKIKELEDREQELIFELMEERKKTENIEQMKSEEIGILLQDVQGCQAQNQVLINELDKNGLKLQEATKRIDHLTHELDNAKKRLPDFELIQTQFEGLKAERDVVTSSLNQANHNINILEKESEELKRELEESYSQFACASQKNEQLSQEIVLLKQEILGLEFAKDSLEASCESSQKLEKPEEILLEPEDSRSLSLKPIGELNEAVKPETSELGESHETKSEQLPLFSAFAQPTSDSIFDSFGNEKWFNQDNVVNQQQLILSHEVEKPETKPIIEDGREALLQKIKALEFLLYNVDKEKEIALEQCTEMVNELTRLIYNKANPELDKQVLSLSEIETKNKKSLEAIEYSPTIASSGEQPLPVVEDIIEPKKTYLCFDNQGTSNLESQIMTDENIALASNKKELEKLEYETVDHSLGEQTQPVIEPMAQPKHAYLCYTKEDKPQSLEAFEENDDGWGWGPEEVRLEEEHVTSLENMPQVKNLLIEIEQLKENLKVMQVERENHLEEIKQLQVKSGKLIKKYKDLKAKSDNSNASSGFFDLNETIQEELKTQVHQLEKKLKELSLELDKEKAEKGNLLKRVDVLTSANERMTEMKEIQDSEVFRWQRKYEETTHKLQQYEWSSDGFAETKTNIGDGNDLPSTSKGNDHSNSKIKELEDTIKELSLDNEELQALLDEQNAKRLEAEKNKSSQHEEELKILNENLNKEVEELKLNLQYFQNEVHRLSEEMDKLMARNSSLEALLRDKETELQNMLVKREQENNQNETFTLKEQLQDTNNAIGELQSRLEEAIQQNAELEEAVAKKYQDLTEKDEKIHNLEDQLTRQAESSNSLIDEKKNLLKYIEELTTEKERFIENSQEDLQQNLQSSQQELEKITSDRDQIYSDYQIALQNLQAKITEVEESQLIIKELHERIDDLENSASERNIKHEENQLLVEKLQAKIKQLEANRQEAENNNEVEALKLEISTKDAELQQLLLNIQNKEQEFQERINVIINELNENWQIQVDQRGADVAESWKMHLEIVEKDYNSVQEKLKADLLELEEKSNILQNENEELKKNVDQEIRNDIDKMSTLQQTINSLNQSIMEKDKRIEELQNNLSNFASLETELQALRLDNAEKENKLSSINIIIETTQKQFDEKREVIEEIVSILERRALTPISYEKDDILLEFNRQLDLIHQKESEIDQLKQYISDLEHNLNKTTGEKTREITGLNQVIEDLEKELSVVHEKEAEIVRLSNELDNILKQKEQLQYDINSNQQEKAELEKLRLEHKNCLLSIEESNKKVLEEQQLLQNLQQELNARTNEVNSLNLQLDHLQEEAKNDSNKEVENLLTTIDQLKEERLVLQTSLSGCQQELFIANQQLAQRNLDLEAANQNILQYQQNCTYYELENQRLQEHTAKCEVDYNNSLEMLKNNQLTDIQRHYDELLSNRDIDIGALRSQVQELIQITENYTERLNQEALVKQQLEQQLREQTQLVDEDTKQLQELKSIIEDQVVRIEELKKELFEKSGQYDSLIAEIDVGRMPVTQQPLAAAVGSPTSSAQKQLYSDEDLSEPVNRAELDLALYMLHQRDVRCEELTVELTQLLEERDTLQLRLSNAIREKEGLRQSSTANSSVSLPDSSNIQGLESQTSAALASKEVKDLLESEKSLATKLSELRNVGYKKDKTFVDEQEARRLQQLAIMQQHINEASKLPPEAAAKLVDASYTLSRDVQSPSKVLLNWLWGKSPPRANES